MALHYVSIAIRKGTFNLDCLVVFDRSLHHRQNALLFVLHIFNKYSI
jgi:hypothetical protein